MKFLTKINRNFFFLLIPILTVISLGGYFILHAIILNEAKKVLYKKEILIKNQIKQTSNIPNIYPIIETTKINHKSIKKPSFKEIFIQNELEDELEPYIEYYNQIEINGTFYSIKIRQSIFENEDLAILFAMVLFILMFSAFITSFFLTKKMNKTIWKVFEQNLAKIENFSFTNNSNLNLLKSNINEFDRLNSVVNQLAQRLKLDYLSLKEFTENASHEIQTPISIVLLNLEEILQQNLNKETFQNVVTSISALKRLSNLNQGLIVLTKIGNNQFKADKTISFNTLLNSKIKEFNVLFESKNIGIDLQLKQDFKIKINEQLADLLVNNLLSNAINHNIKNGSIQIQLYKNKIEICNTGKDITLNEKDIFNRFVKSNSKSFGLGLAIIKNICETNNLEIQYKKNKTHCFTISTKF